MNILAELTGEMCCEWVAHVGPLHKEQEFIA